MNKTKLMVAAFAAIALSACSDSKKAAPQGIPDDLTFTVQKGTPLSPTEIAEITAVVKEISAANKVAMTTQYGEFLLTDTEESDSDKVERNKAYDDLTTEQKAELERAKNVCIIKDNVKQETGSEQNGSSITTSSISGADCPVQFTEKSTVSSKFDPIKEGAFAGTMSMKTEMSTERTDKRSAPIANEVLSQKMFMSLSGTFNGTEENSRGLFSGPMSIEMEIANFGAIKVKGDYKSLSINKDLKSKSVMVFHADVAAAGRSYKLSMRIMDDDTEQGTKREVYLNGTKLDDSLFESLKLNVSKF